MSRGSMVAWYVISGRSPPWIVKASPKTKPAIAKNESAVNDLVSDRLMTLSRCLPGASARVPHSAR